MKYQNLILILLLSKLSWAEDGIVKMWIADGGQFENVIIAKIHNNKTEFYKCDGYLKGTIKLDAIDVIKAQKNPLEKYFRK
jgi:hypothetical protein